MFFDAADLDSEDEEEIMEEFMMAHSEQVLVYCIQCFAASCICADPKSVRSSGREEKMEVHIGRKGVFNPKHYASTFSEEV